MEQVQLLADAPVVALLRLFETGQVFLQLRTRSPGGPVDSLQHLVAGIAAPVRARHLHELERLQFARARHVRSPAEVFPIALPVQADCLAGRDGTDDLGLVVLADALEVLDRCIARQHPPVHLDIPGRDLGHALLDRRQIVARERGLVREVVVKAVLDHRTDGHLRPGKEFLHRVRQQMRGRMADDLQALGILVGHDADCGVVIDHRRGIDQAAVDLAGERRFRKPRTDAGRDVGHRHGLIEDLLVTVGESNYGHMSITNTMRLESGKSPAPLRGRRGAGSATLRGWCALAGSNHRPTPCQDGFTCGTNA